MEPVRTNVTRALIEPAFAVIGLVPGTGGGDLLTALGFVVVTSGAFDAEVASALFELAAATEYQVLNVPGAASPGYLLAVTTPNPGHPRRGRLTGPIELNLFARDADQLAHTLDRMSVARTEIIRWGTRGKQMADFRFTSEEGLDVVAIEYSDRSHGRPSVLDTAPERLTSELTAVAWMVPDVSASRAYWDHGTGMAVVLSNEIRDPLMSALMEVEDLPGLRYANLAAPDEATMRLEIFELVDVATSRRPHNGVMSGGLHAAGLTTRDLDAAAALLGGVRAIRPTPLGRLAAGTAPDGVVWLLREVERD